MLLWLGKVCPKLVSTRDYVKGSLDGGQEDGIGCERSWLGSGPYRLLTTDLGKVFNLPNT